MLNEKNVKKILEEIRETGLDYEILNEKLDDNRQMHLWYGGPVLKFFYKNYEIVIEAIGDVDFTLESYNGDNGFHVIDKQNAGLLGKSLIKYFQNDYQLNTLLETGLGDPNYDAYYKETNRWQFRIVNEKYPEDTIMITDSFVLHNVIEYLQTEEIIGKVIDNIENKTRCPRCNSNNINIYRFSPDDKPYVIRSEYSCKRCKNFWYEDSI